MDAKTLDNLNAIQTSIEDLHNSQVAVVQKAAQLETTLMNSPDKKVKGELATIYSDASGTADKLNVMLEEINERVDKATKELAPKDDTSIS